VLATLAIRLQATWNESVAASCHGLGSVRTIPVGLAAFVGQYSTAWGQLMAGSVIALLPVLIIYVLGQNWFVKGITLSGMGGR
jgi:multiple sugar transport system permease protein